MNNNDILDKYLKTMKHLSDENERLIIIELLKKDHLGISDFEKKVNRTKSTIMRLLKGLEEDGIIKIGELDEKRAGRRKKIYELGNIELPGMNIQDIKEFLLEGKLPKGVQSREITAKFNRMKRFSVKGKTGLLEFDPTLLVSDLLLSGLDIMEAIEIVLEFETLLVEGLLSEEISDGVANLLEKKDPIYAERYRDLVKKELFLEPSTSERWNMEDISRMIRNQFGLTDNETKMLISEFGRLLEFLGIYKFSYNYLMQTFYLLAKKYSIEVKESNMGNFWVPEGSDLMITGKNINKKIFSALLKSKEFSEKEKEEIGALRNLFSKYHSRILEKAREMKIMIPSEDYVHYKRINILKEDNIPDFWEAGNFSKYIERKFHLDFRKSQYVGTEVFKRLQRLDLEKVPLHLVDDLCREILVEKGLRKYERPRKKLAVEHFFKFKGKNILPRAERSPALNYLVENLADREKKEQIYVHGINGWLAVPNQLQHDLRWFLTAGFNFRPVMNPPENVAELIQLLVRIIDEFSNEVALNQNFDLFNILVSPYFGDMEYDEIKRSMRLLISELDRKTCSIGLGIEIETPEFLRHQHVWTKKKVKKAYENFEEESINVAKAVLEVLVEGDSAGNFYRNPKVVLKLRKSSLNDVGILEAVSSLIDKYSGQDISKTPPPLIMANCAGDPPNSNSSYFCSGQGIQVPHWKDSFGVSNLQTISLNMPAVLTDKPSEEEAIERIEDLASVIASSLIQKTDIIKNGLQKKKLPLLAISPWEERNHYLNLTNSFSTIGISRMRKAIFNLRGSFPEKSEDILEFSLRLVSSVQASIDRYIGEIRDEEPHILISHTSPFSLTRRDKPDEEWPPTQFTEANIKREERIQHLLKGGKIFYIGKPETDLKGSLKRLMDSSIKLFAFAAEKES